MRKPYDDVTVDARSEWTNFIPTRCDAAIADDRAGTAVHWTGSSATLIKNCLAAGHSQCHAEIRTIEQYQLNSTEYDYCAIEYNYVVCAHGHVIVGRGKHLRTGANGTTDANTHYGATLMLMGTGETPNDKMLHALRASGMLLAPNHPVRFRPHSDFVSTACPGNVLRKWIANGCKDPLVRNTSRLRKLLASLRDRKSAIAKRIKRVRNRLS